MDERTKKPTRIELKSLKFIDTVHYCRIDRDLRFEVFNAIKMFQLIGTKKSAWIG